ncbi:ThiF family adenylyltransferase [Kribbella ginsengisoli]|uniref:ThiF family adenylyltransferase n=1 Tax=Kribbella ginsengisoli TaxID=363865 RepID=A0ABP6X3S9_9ACTN
MSTSPFGLDPSTRRLLDEDYCLSFEGNHLIVEHVPYATTGGAVAYGRLALPVVFSGDAVHDGSGDHRIWFVGEQPCDQHGRPLPGPSPEAHAITAELSADFMISSKPKDGGSYANTYDKITSYVRILSHPAIALDPAANPRPGAGWTEVPDDLPFVYPDTGTARAGLAAVNAKFRGHRIGIVGLGGTGSFILDQVSKTWVDAIDLFDGDVFDNHNAYRAPGAADIEDLKRRPNKAEYFASVYGHMHTGITAHPVFITADNVSRLGDCTFVFMAAADAEDKPAIITWLRERRIPMVEVGMGIRDEGGCLSGLLAVVNHFPEAPEGTVAGAAAAPDEYDRNIQTADLNSLNAMLAVINWKKYLGYYAEFEPVDETVYRIFTGTIRNGAERGAERAGADAE